MFDLTIPAHSYILGFLQTDGHMRQSSRNRGRISLEIQAGDILILEKIQSVLPIKSIISQRTRRTNFSENYSSACLNIFDLEFRTLLNKLGLPYGKKSAIIAPPTSEFVERDYIRGLIDGDGSVGFTEKNFPFISFTTESEEMAKFYKPFKEKFTGVKCRVKRNKRDNIYNFMCCRESAQAMAAYLYYDGCLALSRKKAKSEEVIAWERPERMKKRKPGKPWTLDQDEYILTHSLDESMKKLGRSKQSIKTRLWRLI